MIKNISKNILLKYTILPNDYNIIMINHLIMNSDSHLICLFKDYLLYDDPSEFLKCFYKKFQIKSRLKHLTNYLFKAEIMKKIEENKDSKIFSFEYLQLIKHLWLLEDKDIEQYGNNIGC